MKRKTIRILCLCLLLALAGGGVYAWLSSNSDAVTNTVTPAAVSTAVREEDAAAGKQNVCVENTGGVTAYIRAAVVVNLLDAQGNISAKTPEPGTDYTITDPAEGLDARRRRVLLLYAPGRAGRMHGGSDRAL